MSAAVRIGSTPRRVDTVRAEVLALLAEGNRLSGLDAVALASSTRLAAHIGALENKYGWDIQRDHRAAPCKDGRVAWVCVYHLSSATVDALRKAGVRQWVAKVREARAARAKEAPAARRRAKRINAAADARQHAFNFDDGDGDGDGD